MGLPCPHAEADHPQSAWVAECGQPLGAEAHRVDLLYAGTIPSLAVSLAVAVTLAFVQSGYYPVSFVWSWVALMAAVLLGRYVLLLRYRKAAGSSRDPRTWAARYSMGAWAAGALWGAAGLLFFPADSPFHQVFTLLALAGISAGALTVLAVDSRGYSGFAGLCLVPVALHSIFRADDTHLAMGMLALVFMLFLLRAGKGISEAVVTSLELRYENHELVDKLAREKDRLDHRLTRLFNDLTSEILVFDAETLLCREANAGASRGLGRSSEALRGMPLCEIHPELDREAFHLLAKPLREGRVKQVSFRGQHRRDDGTLYPVEARLQFAQREDPPVFVVTALDVTERETAEVRARERGAFVRSMLRSAPIALWAVATDGRVTRVNGNTSLIRPGSPAFRIGVKISALEPTYPQIVQDVKKALEGSSVSSDVIVGKRTLEVHHSPMKGESGEITGAIGVAVDITERKTFETRLLKQANTDALTQLPNLAYARRRLSEALAAADRNQRKLAVLFLDLDNFKNVNDSLGHSAGDSLLVEVAQRLVDCVRGSDHIARMGGDEFLLLVEGVSDPREAEVVARKLLQAMSRPFSVDGQELCITVSVGIAVYPDDGQTPEALIQHADSALYGAKDGGRNTYRFFTHEMRTAAEHRMAIESSLRRALKRGELSLRYQPLMRIADQAIVGAEALLRWNSPELGEVPPTTFISVAEDAGLIPAIGDWALRAACREANRWQSVAGRPMRLSVNVSSRQLRGAGFLIRLRETLAAAGLPFDLLDLEITERVLVEDAPPTLTLLNSLTEMGVRLALDDFGTGYSSLSYLTRFPVHSIKIDRSFIMNLHASGSATGIVDAIIALAQKLKLEVVAEGVETSEQLAYLREQEVQLAQGFYICEPIHAEDFRALIGSRRRWQCGAERQRALSHSTAR